MKWSLRIGTLDGIGLYVHVTFLMLIGWIAVHEWNTHHSYIAVVQGVTFVVSLFGCIVLHELGHALAARRYGIATQDITLLPIGGLARLERMPKDPNQELVVALAGPLVNVVIAAAIYVALLLGGAIVTTENATVFGQAFLSRLMLVNVILVLFNLIPAFPMDGGRVLRAILATRMNYVEATSRAAQTGQSIAVFFAVTGIFMNPFLVLIAVFVWVAAAQEAASVQIQSALDGIPVRDAMVTQFRSLQDDMTIQDAMDLTLSSDQKDFPVVRGRELIGLLTQVRLLEALAEKGKEANVADVMHREVSFALPEESVNHVLQRFEQSGGRTMPVVVDDRLVGMMTMDNIGELIQIQKSVSRFDAVRRGHANRGIRFDARDVGATKNQSTSAAHHVST